MTPDELDALMTRLSLTGNDLARALDISPTTVTTLRRDGTTKSLYTLALRQLETDMTPTPLADTIYDYLTRGGYDIEGAYAYREALSRRPWGRDMMAAIFDAGMAPEGTDEEAIASALHQATDRLYRQAEASGIASQVQSNRERLATIATRWAQDRREAVVTEAVRVMLRDHRERALDPDAPQASCKRLVTRMLQEGVEDLTARGAAFPVGVTQREFEDVHHLVVERIREMGVWP